MVLDELRDSTLRRVNGDLLDPAVPPRKMGHMTDGEEDSMLTRFLQSEREVARFRNGQPVVVDGHTLTTAGVVAAARFHAKIELDDCHRVKDRIAKSRKVISDKVDSGTSVYGLSTGFGGSADTRTDKPLLLGHALLQHQHVGVLPTSGKAPEGLPLLDPLSSTAMPESWVRGAMLVRMNSLIRGHSGVRWELLEKMKEVFMANITPAVPVRTSISASGDLSPLSYIAGTLVANPSIKVFHTPPSSDSRQLTSSADALSQHGIEPISLASKEHLGILNGTAFSASVAALVMHDAMQLALLSQVCTALGTEALRGNIGSYAPFIHATARPHPGQVETARNIWNLLQGSSLAQLHEEEVGLSQDKYNLRQDRYPLRTSPQFLGPQVEDILAALSTVQLECNSTTDNPLIDGETGHVHHGGNFQAMAVTNAMEKTRLALHHIGKLMFAQSTELSNPAMNNGLPPNLAASDPSLNYHGKGIDIATAAYVAELGHLAAPVSTHIQSAEMHNQAVNSLALISARSTVNSVQVLSMLIASYLYLLCQAVDLRALQHEFEAGLKDIIKEELSSSFSLLSTEGDSQGLSSEIFHLMRQSLDKNTTMDNTDRMTTAATSTSTLLLTKVTSSSLDAATKGSALAHIPEFQSRVATRAAALQQQLRDEFLSGKRGPAPAASLLGKTQAVYRYVRTNLGIRMHGSENHGQFTNGIGHDEVTIGENISTIYEAIRDGHMSSVVVSLFH
ncbi:phenylalanine ammonium lyase [Coprinopsis cinerea okayama7|uniref:Phenylalanine ammonium lyase n=1 Tax=Coprinopsis cinerea (strain Okayama-7 / 130 / ATCC MYA-4618 / FGSC 9003) TaxID=240176 RepID=A8N6W6_COPC7|nr:phenylalanine ammonium lyase [Coprinopsis cinerea okayama7\|eukprot:XP_001830572.2 phenylalanine ammonium lyase [Coprinopsis cinerea okayama7\